MATSEPANVAELIQQYAQLQFTTGEIATLAEIPLGELLAAIQQEGHPWGRAYLRGQLLGEAAVRGQMFTDATKGKLEAQRAFGQLVTERRRKERKEGVRPPR